MTYQDKMKSATKILIVEDDAELRKKYGTILKRLKYQIQMSDGFGSVVGLIEQYQPKIVLMDSMLPSIIGWEECRKIRETDYGRTIGIIGMSSDDVSGEWTRTGADLFLHKGDINLLTLEAAIEKVLEKYR